ncbi:hypothetical protein GOP47_0000845 [Adiantum capillus-veneris]|uniref:Uncharacterized protein n=1 Tax=Adiantum capillus-veneris TaxID=13818 RepID=A0A9D4VDR6_ADICA|nr:hypothetical protein GOP47_0000845 [Adiantum capillus-veneris]
MLSSPGNSPRQIVWTPSQQHGESHRGVVARSGKTLMGPPPPKRPRRTATVLDEDSYVAAIEKIVERDFFPDIPKLQDRLEWLEAIRTGDPMIIRDAQMNIMQRRREKSDMALGVTPTPASLACTPASAFLGSPLSMYTSEDNASFSKILETTNQKRREKYRFLTEEELVSPQDRIADREHLPTDGYGTSNQPLSTLEGWSYKAKNLLMYDSAERDDAPLTEEEKEARLKSLSKEISTRNTRFHGNMFDTKLKEDAAAAPMYSPMLGVTPRSAWNLVDSEKLKVKYDLEELRRTPHILAEKEINKVLGRGGTSGYNYVATPSPAPGVDESPFMTWGEIEGTPLRLEAEDTPVGIGGSGDGPHFKIPAPPSRDARAHSLSRDAARSLREKWRLSHSRASPSPARGSGSPALKSLSAAAQDFVRKAMAKSSASVDARLRASYRGSATPYTPKSVHHDLYICLETYGVVSYSGKTFKLEARGANVDMPAASNVEYGISDLRHVEPLMRSYSLV